MPFTVSHIAAVLPAYRPLARAHLFTAAVIGSMVPDFGLLLPDTPARVETHSFEALFTFCLPVGLALYVVTLVLIKPAVLQIVPDGAYVRLSAADATAPRVSLRGALLAILTLLAGAATHLLWDTFTHENARGVRMFPVLDEFGPEINGYSIHLYRWLQYGSSIFGIIVVTAALMLWLRHARAPSPRPYRRLSCPERSVWFGAYIAPPLLTLIAAYLHTHGPGVGPKPLGTVLDVMAINSMRASVVSLVLVSLALRARLTLSGAAPAS
jgi:hypothetical protein